ncbi:hypothetical protein OD91_2423 [Lutibacter sp. Hel_I_33_5]|uniref:hypothetical protein n=1 Tax=Lutibacter sp. Hel_I_33_5 TaxID=1566289 RepID=UPI0011A2BE82|nr:hypothetical protein [Lutibacter sp. Hel_I_33_5]TVZ57116.1 hypothetical protein OD91_2423 [Lutibacter sp. Hel_I_33_5]
MQLKHLFVFLIVLLISVADCPVYSQNNSSKYYQSSKSIHKKKFSSKNTKHIVFKQNTLSSKYFLNFFFPIIDIKSEFQKQIQLAIKLQKQVYQKIALLNIKHTFLIHKVTASNFISNLYIA